MPLDPPNPEPEDVPFKPEAPDTPVQPDPVRPTARPEPEVQQPETPHFPPISHGPPVVPVHDFVKMTEGMHNAIYTYEHPAVKTV